jgi:hypothetical protein
MSIIEATLESQTWRPNFDPLPVTTEWTHSLGIVEFPEMSRVRWSRYSWLIELLYIGHIDIELIGIAAMCNQYYRQPRRLALWQLVSHMIGVPRISNRIKSLHQLKEGITGGLITGLPACYP